jgi:hypothetical protein
MGGFQGFPARASRMAVKTATPCLAAVEAYPRIAYRLRVVFCERSRPENFCWVSQAAGHVRWLDLRLSRLDLQTRDEPVTQCEVVGQVHLAAGEVSLEVRIDLVTLEVISGFE